MERPRRSTRTPMKYKETSEIETIETIAVQPASISTIRKRKERTKEDTNSLEFILSNPKSPLVNIDLLV